MSEEFKEDYLQPEKIGSEESALDAEKLSTNAEEPEKALGSEQRSGSLLQKQISEIISRSEITVQLLGNDFEQERLVEEEQNRESFSDINKSFNFEQEKSIASFLENGEGEEQRPEQQEENKTESKVGSEGEGLAIGLEAESAEDTTTLLGSRSTGLGVSRQASPAKLQEKLLALDNRASDVLEEKPQEHAPVEEWSDEVWLQIAARQRALRRSRKPADIALRKQKYPELFRSDVSIYPSYTEYRLPYFVVARQRYLRSLRLIQEQIKGDLEEMALLQPRALDGVRIIRTFCQGAQPDSHKDPLNPKERRRLEYLLAGNIY